MKDIKINSSAPEQTEPTSELNDKKQIRISPKIHKRILVVLISALAVVNVALGTILLIKHVSPPVISLTPQTTEKKEEPLSNESTSPTTQESPKTEKAPLSVAKFNEMAEGSWIDESSVSVTAQGEYTYSNCYFSDGYFGSGSYPGSGSRLGQVTKVEELGENEYEVTLYYKAEEYMGDLYQESYDKIQVTFSEKDKIYIQGENWGPIHCFRTKDTNEQIQAHLKELFPQEEKQQPTKTENNQKPVKLTWSEAFTNQIESAIERFPDYSYSCNYSLYDIDGNGIPELFLKTGTSEADYTFTGFRYNSEQGSCQNIVTWQGGHTHLCGTKDKNSILLYWGHMGSEEVTQMTLQNGKFVETKTWEIDNPDGSFYLTPLSIYELDDPSGLKWSKNESENNQELLQKYLENQAKVQSNTSEETISRICNYCSYDEGDIKMTIEKNVETDIIWTCSSCNKENHNYYTIYSYIP